VVSGFPEKMPGLALRHGVVSLVQSSQGFIWSRRSGSAEGTCLIYFVAPRSSMWPMAIRGRRALRHAPLGSHAEVSAPKRQPRKLATRLAPCQAK
jgi:hypothetical protein